MSRRDAPTPDLTEAAFAQICAYIASRAAGWAGDGLILPENHGRQASAATVARFTDELRGTLDRLDERAGRKGSPDTLAALKTAHERLEHMAKFIGDRKLGYSFEALGEDIGDIRDAIATAEGRAAATGAAPAGLFSPDDVVALANWQMPQPDPADPFKFRGHPFTCPNRGDGNHRNVFGDLGALVPTVRGWVCPFCDYTQNWAHGFMKAEVPS